MPKSNKSSKSRGSKPIRTEYKRTETKLPVRLKVFSMKNTAKAVLCVLDSERLKRDAKEYWFPYSQIEVIDIDHDADVYTIDVPHWLAKEKGLAK